MLAFLTLENLSIAVLTLSLAFVILLIVFVKYSQAMNARLGQSIKLINDLYNLSKQHSEAIKILQSDTNASDNQDTQSAQISIKSEVSEIRHQLASIGQELLRLDNKTDQLQQQDPATKMYTKANKLVSQGASLEDIMEACDLPRAEVDMLIGLHRRK